MGKSHKIFETFFSYKTDGRIRVTVLLHRSNNQVRRDSGHEYAMSSVTHGVNTGADSCSPRLTAPFPPAEQAC